MKIYYFREQLPLTYPSMSQVASSNNKDTWHGFDASQRDQKHRKDNLSKHI